MMKTKVNITNKKHEFIYSDGGCELMIIAMDSSFEKCGRMKESKKHAPTSPYITDACLAYEGELVDILAMHGQERGMSRWI